MYQGTNIKHSIKHILHTPAVSFTTAHEVEIECDSLLLETGNKIKLSVLLLQNGLPLHTLLFK